MFARTLFLLVVLSLGIQPLRAQDDEEDLQKRLASQREDIQQLKEKVGQFQNDVQAYTAEHAQLKSELGVVKNQLTAAQKEIQRLGDLLRDVDQAREKDRRLIVEEVSKEMARILDKNKAGSPKSAQSSNPPKKTVMEEGYEHIVAKGETVHAIAEAYGVSKKSIMAANGLKKDELKIGQKLFIPKKK